MRRYRIGIFERGTAPADGGADTLLHAIISRMSDFRLRSEVEIVPVAWSAWSHRRRVLRYLWSHCVRHFGGEIPLVDLRPLCRRLQLDIAYFAAPAFVRIDIPFIFTVWDLAHRTIPEFPEVRANPRDPWTQRETLYQDMLGQASYVITGNATGAAEVREHFHVPREKIVILPFPNPDFIDVTAQTSAVVPARPFFLYPAQLWAHKNHITLLHALAAIARKSIPIPELVLVGSDKGNIAHLRETAAALRVSEYVTFAGFVSRGELKALYQRATGLTFASLLGPNNLPPQEAAVLGCPVLLSDLPGHREQMGDGALYVSPLQAGDWADAMLMLLQNPERRVSLAAAARRVVASYTVEAYIAGVADLISRLARIRALWS